MMTEKVGVAPGCTVAAERGATNGAASFTAYALLRRGLLAAPRSILPARAGRRRQKQGTQALAPSGSSSSPCRASPAPNGRFRATSAQQPGLQYLRARAFRVALRPNTRDAPHVATSDRSGGGPASSHAP